MKRALLFLLPLVSLAAPPDGARLYKSECARCHGRQGEGVAKKHKQPLAGDWSVARLARYIAKEMPDDDPGALSAADAEAVAAYLHGGFYSPEARARLHPPRVELLHLSNRQYIETLADLLGDDAQRGGVGPERGLRATYRATREKWQDKDGRTAVNPAIDFDFGANQPDGQPVGTNGFSVEWRGSLLAPDTGEYAFTLRTPNGARLWLNDMEEPLIDAYVASGTNVEHGATCRLVGGRAYPLRVEMFRFKERTSAISLRWRPPYGVDQVVPEYALARDSAPPSYVVRTPFPADDSSVGYERGALVSKEWDEATTHAAIDAAAAFVRRLDALTGTKPGDSNRAAKVHDAVAAFAARAFRRPLPADLQSQYVDGPLHKAATPDEGAKRAVLLALKSPRFLYLGLARAPDDYETAERLSYALWDSIPDAELRTAAEQGRLRTRGEVVAQARRMLGDPRAHAKMRGFLHHWLQVDRVEEISKDAALFPEFTPEVAADLRVSLDLFLDEAVWAGSGDYRQLLRSESLYLNGRLAPLYGITGGTAGFTKVALDPRQRCGVLTHPYLLSAFSYPRSSSPIHRGVFLTRKIVGRELRPPPMAVAFKDAEFKPGMSMREKVEELTRPEACQTCHSVINPLGFALEQYDAIGRFRTREGDRAVEAAADVPLDDGGALHLTGPRDLAEFAAASPQAHAEFVEQLFHHMAKQALRAYGADVPERLRASFEAAQCDVRALAVDISAVVALHGRADVVAAGEAK